MGCATSMPSVRATGGSELIEETKISVPPRPHTNQSQFPFTKLPEAIQKAIFAKVSCAPRRHRRGDAAPKEAALASGAKDGFLFLTEISPAMLLETMRLTPSLCLDIGDLRFLTRLVWLAHHRPLQLTQSLEGNPSLSFRATGHPSFLADALGRTTAGQLVLSRLQFLEVTSILPRAMLRELRLKEEWANKEFVRSEWASKVLQLAGKSRPQASLSLRRCTTGTRELGQVHKASLYAFAKKHAQNLKLQSINLRAQDYAGDVELDGSPLVATEVDPLPRSADDVDRLLDKAAIRSARVVTPEQGGDVEFEWGQTVRSLSAMPQLVRLAIEGRTRMPSLDLTFLADHALKHLSIRVQCDVVIGLDRLRGLESLTLRCTVTRDLADQLKTLTDLRSLQLVSVLDPCELGRSVLPALSQLTFLALGDEENLHTAAQRSVIAHAHPNPRALNYSASCFSFRDTSFPTTPNGHIARTPLWAEGHADAAPTSEESILIESVDGSDCAHVAEACVAAGLCRPLDIAAVLHAMERPLPALVKFEAVGALQDLTAVPRVFPNLVELSAVHCDCSAFDALVAPPGSERDRRSSRNLLEALQTGGRGNRSSSGQGRMKHKTPSVPILENQQYLGAGSDGNSEDESDRTSEGLLSYSPLSRASPRHDKHATDSTHALPTALSLSKLPSRNAEPELVDLSDMPTLTRVVLALHYRMDCRLRLPESLRELNLDLKVVDGLQERLLFPTRGRDLRTFRVMGLNLSAPEPASPSSPSAPSPSVQLEALEHVLKHLPRAAFVEVKLTDHELPFAFGLQSPLGDFPGADPTSTEGRGDLEVQPATTKAMHAFADHLATLLCCAPALRQVQLTLLLSNYSNWAAVAIFQRFLVEAFARASQAKAAPRPAVDPIFRYNVIV